MPEFDLKYWTAAGKLRAQRGEAVKIEVDLFSLMLIIENVYTHTSPLIRRGKQELIENVRVVLDAVIAEGGND